MDIDDPAASAPAASEPAASEPVASEPVASGVDSDATEGDSEDEAVGGVYLHLSRRFVSESGL